MITKEEFIMIHELHKCGHSIREIARITGIDRKTISKRLAQDQLQNIVRTKSSSKLALYKEYIINRISAIT